MKLEAIGRMMSMIPAVLRGVRPQDIERINGIARAAFPTVEQVSTGTLAQWLESGEKLLLVDVRSKEEFAVSHLKGGVNARTVNEILQARAGNEDVILYCSVGFRSSALAAALQKRGLAGVSNLEGSIFQWANEGRAVYRGGKVVREVHPYGERWAGLLVPEVRRVFGEFDGELGRGFVVPKKDSAV